MASLGDSPGERAAPPRDARFERKALLAFALFCLTLGAAFLLFPSLWDALVNPYETMTKAMATIAELCRW